MLFRINRNESEDMELTGHFTFPGFCCVKKLECQFQTTNFYLASALRRCVFCESVINR